MTILAAILLLSASGAQANQPSSLEDREALRQEMLQRLDQLATEMELTDEQRDQVRAIVEESGERTRAVLEQHGVSADNPPQSRQDRLALGRDLRPIRQWREDELATVLDPEQMQQLREWLNQLRQELMAQRE